jgi:sulfur relay (sulfurtransferase) complex TusBCD TusD component (DsrE family)
MSMERTVIYLFTNDGMGQTHDQVLRQMLAVKLFQLMMLADPLPKAVCFYTDGVRLACEGSPVLKELEALERRGVQLLLCSTCLTQLGLREAVRVGIVGGMTDILTAMHTADSVVTL